MVYTVEISSGSPMYVANVSNGLSAAESVREENLAAGNPVISVDAKKKKLVGDFKNAGREWRPTGDPQQVNVGVDRDTAMSAVESIRRWRNTMEAAATAAGSSFRKRNSRASATRSGFPSPSPISSGYQQMEQD
jgi:hypothetical protein